MDKGTAVSWRGFGRIWHGKTTGNISPDGYHEVELAPGSGEWTSNEGKGWVLTSHLHRAGE